jgi:hypothetical protein
MNRSRVHIGLFAVGFGFLLLPLTLSAQDRQIITKQITLGSSVAELSLELTGDGRLNIRFDDGVVQVDGQVAGRIDPGDRLEVAWRLLLEGVVTLEDGPLAERLLAWSAPEGLAAEVDSIAQEIEQALQGALESVDTQAQTEQVEVSVSIETEGDVVGLLERTPEQEAEIRNRIRVELREEIQEEINQIARRGGDSLGVGGNVFLGLFGLIGNLLLIAVLSLMGGVLVKLGGGHVDTIAETAHRSPGRSALVGLGGTLLLMPVWLLGFVGLLISIIGIPLAIAWLPLFWLLVSMAFITGFVSVARSAGEWVADSGFRWTDRIQKSNAIHTVFVGLFVLLSGFLIADVISILPFSGFLTGVLILIGCVVTVAASQIGFGAVLLTRAGRRRVSRYTQNDTGVADQEADSPREVNTDEDG